MLPRFLRQLGIFHMDSLVHFGLAHLQAYSRGIARLGVIHRAGLDSGPVQLRQFFKLDRGNASRYVRYRHSRHLEDLCGMRNCPNFLSRSVVGLIAVYNVLPEYVVASKTVKAFQTNLHNLVKYLATTGHGEWKTCLNRSSLPRTVLPRVSREAVRSQGALLPPPRLHSW